MLLGMLTYTGITLSKLGNADIERRASAAARALSAANSQEALNAELSRLRVLDSNFSIPLFLDFIQLLYVRSHEGRGEGKLDHLSPYLSVRLRKRLLDLSPTKGELIAVKKVIVGSAQITKVRISHSRTKLQIKLEANFTEVHRSGTGATTQKDWLSNETWSLDKKLWSPSLGPRGYHCSELS